MVAAAHLWMLDSTVSDRWLFVQLQTSHLTPLALADFCVSSWGSYLTYILALWCLPLRRFQQQHVCVISLALQDAGLKVAERNKSLFLFQVTAVKYFSYSQLIFFSHFFFPLPLYPHSGVHRHSTSCPVGPCPSAG